MPMSKSNNDPVSRTAAKQMIASHNVKAGSGGHRMAGGSQMSAAAQMSGGAAMMKSVFKGPSGR